MAKSADAFRTISEVADWLGVPTHVLRFWESKFPQVKPVKRAGGRRYYRPSDMMLLAGIRVLLHDDGVTIRGVQKILREKGVKHVTGLADREVMDAQAQAPEEIEKQKPQETADIVDLPRKEPEKQVLMKVPDAEPEGEETSESAAAPSAPTKQERDAGEASEEELDQMQLFSEQAETEPTPLREAQSEPAASGQTGSLELPGASPESSASVRSILDALESASPEDKAALYARLASHKDMLEALRDKLANSPEQQGSDAAP